MCIVDISVQNVERASQAEADLEIIKKKRAREGPDTEESERQAKIPTVEAPAATATPVLPGMHEG